MAEDIGNLVGLSQYIVPILTETLKLGAAGLFLIYLALAVRSRDKVIEALLLRIADLQEKRVSEAVKTVTTIGANTAAIEKLGATNGALATEIADLSEYVRHGK